ncbi:unnamed protein product, partial [Mesorhabditis belari]|uniref:Uncharacterized protein n=1 Tax=Mesorhabditis belari TaxID=2138241 RepID=A0AAF3EY97_9BILA
MTILRLPTLILFFVLLTICDAIPLYRRISNERRNDPKQQLLLWPEDVGSIKNLPKRIRRSQPLGAEILYGDAENSYWESPRWRRSQPTGAESLYDTEQSLQWPVARLRRSIPLDIENFYGTTQDSLFDSWPMARNRRTMDFESLYDENQMNEYPVLWSLSRRRRSQPIETDYSDEFKIDPIGSPIPVIYVN